MLKFHGSGCSVLAYLCKKKNNIYILLSEFQGGNIYSSILILGTSFSSVT